MDVYGSENEQLDALRRFLAENGKLLFMMIVFVLAGMAGWHYWNAYQTKTARLTSQHYQDEMQHLKAEKADALGSVTTFVAKNDNSYAVLAAMAAAEKAVAHQQLKDAELQLQAGLKKTKDDNLTAIVSLRLARLQIQQKRPDDALNTLKNVKGEGWKALSADLRGDALLSKNDIQGAREAWNGGVLDDISPALREIMLMKIKNLSS